LKKLAEREKQRQTELIIKKEAAAVMNKKVGPALEYVS
jgi:hypothetical protein